MIDKTVSQVGSEVGSEVGNEVGNEAGSQIGGQVGGQAGNEATDKNTDFGSLLAEARKAKNYSVEDISEFLKIDARTITALESNDIDVLPAATFTQGYIRAYAKFLEISDDAVLDVYFRAVPNDEVSDLKPRSNLPGEASSQSPLIKAITILLILAGIAAVVFGSFQYYQEKVGVMESELDDKEALFTGNSLDSPGSRRLNITQNARLTDDGELVVEKTDPFEYMAEENSAGKTEEGNQDAGGAEADSSERDGSEKGAETTNIQAEAGQSEASEEIISDSIEIFAENGSWVQVHDANNSRLLYNTLPAGSSRVLEGQAPFSITMGNARTTRVVINGIEVDVTDYISQKNTASFKVSTQEQNIIFH